MWSLLLCLGVAVIAQAGESKTLEAAIDTRINEYVKAEHIAKLWSARAGLSKAAENKIRASFLEGARVRAEADREERILLKSLLSLIRDPQVNQDEIAKVSDRIADLARDVEERELRTKIRLYASMDKADREKLASMEIEDLLGR